MLEMWLHLGEGPGVRGTALPIMLNLCRKKQYCEKS